MLRLRPILFCTFLIALFSFAEQAHGQDCTPPEFTYIFTGDCQIGEFYVELDFTSLGDSPSITVITDVFGDVIDYPDVGLGVLVVGPFYEGDVLDLSIIHGGDPECDSFFTGLNPAGSCPFFLACGVPPITLNYCYLNNETIFWIFEGLGEGSLRLDFLTGEIAPGDVLTVHDGPDDSYDIIYQYDGDEIMDLTSITLFSSGPNMYVSLVTDGSISCSDGDLVQWSWQMACLSCAVPILTSTVVDDCENDQFSIHLDFSSTGGAPVDLQLNVDGSPQLIEDVTVGLTILGPYELDQQVNVLVIHADDNMCNVPLGIFTDTGYCPQLVVCGEPPLTDTYCYGDEESFFWLYEVVGDDSALYLEFTAGTIDGGDSLVIYDGPNASSPIIFENPASSFGLAGLVLIPSSGSLFITLNTNSSVSCVGGGATQWAWSVSCIDCIPPVATFDIVQDCDNFQFYVDVNLSNLGTDPEVQITNTGGAPAVMVSTPGNVLVGPFVSGTPVQLTLVNDANPLCNVVSPEMVNPFCPTLVCGTDPTVETYCYGPNEDMIWAYALPGTGTLRLRFNIGTIQSATSDSLRIFDGPDNQSPLLFEHTNTATSDLGPPGSAIDGPGNNYYGVDVTATGSSIYMELVSNGTLQCSTSSNYDPMEWEVFCEGCVPPGLSYSLEPDCEHLAYNVVVEVTELNGPLGLQISEATSGQSLTANQIDSYDLTGFALDSTINVIIQDLDEGGCTYNSGPLVYDREDCVISSCGFDNYEVCYEDDEDLWYTFRSTGGMPVALFFHQGQMLPGDNITIYNGLSGLPGQNVIYNGNNSGNLTGITTSSSNPNNALTLRIRSDGSGSCEDGTATIPIRWDVGCGFVGVNEIGMESFTIYPNPTEGILTLDLGGIADGPVNVRVLDMSGRIAHEQVIPAAHGRSNVLDLAMLQNGQYMVQLTSRDRVGIRPFQIMR